MEPKLTPTFADLNATEPRHEPISVTLQPQPYTLASVIPPTIPAELPAKPKRKVAIVGTAPSSRDLAPYGDPSWEIWACSPGNQNIIPRVTRWYELHVNLLWPANAHYGAPYIEWLKANSGNFEIWMQDHEDWDQTKEYGIPNVKAFPWKELVEEFGPYFFTSTFAWCMAQAIHEGADEISLFGVDMASRDEYILQRPGGHYFIWECMRRGIEVSIPYESDLEQPSGLYAISESSPFLRKLLAREAELKGRIAPMEQQLASLQTQTTYLKGALEDMDYQKSIWASAQHGKWIRAIRPKPLPPLPAPLPEQPLVIPSVENGNQQHA